jgi:hypothetical protein
MAMRVNDLVLVGSVLVLTLSALSDGFGQAPSDVHLEKAILEQIKEAYKAVYEAPKAFRDELNGYYKKPTPQREAAMLKEVGRLYLLTAEQEEVILQEVRKAYAQRSPEQEELIFLEIGKARRLPAGAVSPSVQSSYVSKLFAKLDRNGDGLLSDGEMNDALRAERARCDFNSDGLISEKEYGAYYQSRLHWICEKVAMGQIDLGLKRGGPLPTWFVELDTDRDGQVAIHEWHKAGKPLPDFAAWDRDGDGLATPAEVLRRMAQINRDFGLAVKNAGPSTLNPTKDKEKK